MGHDLREIPNGIVDGVAVLISVILIAVVLSILPRPLRAMESEAGARSPREA